MRLVLIAISLLVACKSEPNNDDTHEETPTDTGVRSDSGDTEDTEPQEETGETLFMDHCSGCHAPDGSGTSIGPPIASVVKQKDEALLLDIILTGTGNMDPIDVTPSQAQMIIDFLRSDSF